jgi:GH25 family lysozyme M1 (1,4-beta-N-acetylmuramidase)
MRISIPLIATIVPLLLNSCGSSSSRNSSYGRVPFSDAPKVVNVSSYDPKERQRPGDSFSSTDVSALRRNGAHGLIARCGKGLVLDDKCADFLMAAERQGMMLGTYYFVLKTSSPVAQADQYIDRLRQIAPGRRVLLVGDFDTKSSAADLVAFINRVEQRTGVLPAIYLENSDRLRASLSSASSAQKSRICQCPYWIALYSHGTVDARLWHLGRLGDVAIRRRKVVGPLRLPALSPRPVESAEVFRHDGPPVRAQCLQRLGE